MRLLTSLLAAAGLACAQTATGVDIAWKVLPRRVAADSFGARTAKLYFAVVAVIGNNSGHDLQVSSVLFQLPEEAGLRAPVPADPYRIVRGTLEREHQVGLRSTTINIIKGLGPILTGGTAFYRSTAYSRIINLFSNPFEKGIELVFPDKTIAQMAALDSQALRDVTIIGKDTQQVVLVFVSRDLLVNDRNRSRLVKFRGEFEPLAVMHALGDMVLVGRSIEYVNRITVKAKAQ
jgi:hypothetical protein